MSAEYAERGGSRTKAHHRRQTKSFTAPQRAKHYDMSSKSTIILTSNSEHWYTDASEPLSSEPYKDAITLEFSKKNIRVDCNDEFDLIVTITNPNSEIYEMLAKLAKEIRGY